MYVDYYRSSKLKLICTTSSYTRAVNRPLIIHKYFYPFNSNHFVKLQFALEGYVRGHLTESFNSAQYLPSINHSHRLFDDGRQGRGRCLPRRCSRSISLLWLHSSCESHPQKREATTA